MTFRLLACMLLLLMNFYPSQAQATDPNPGQVQLTLIDALKLALAEQPAMALARNNQKSASVAVGTARANFLPDLQTKASASERYAQQSQPGQSGDLQTLSVGLTSSLNLFNGFADEANLNTARRQLDAASAALLRQVQTTLINTATAYIDVLSNRELIKSAEQNLSREEALRARIEALHKAGNLSVSDLYQQQAAKARAELDLLDARRNLEIAHLLLEQNLGQQPAGEIDPQPVDPFALGDVLKEIESSATLRLALERRPDLIAQVRQLEAARATVRQVRAGQLPRLDLVGSADTSYNSGNNGRDFGSQLSRDNGVASLGLSLSLPLFDRHQTRNGITQARISEDDAAIKIAQLRQQIGVEVGQALADYRHANLKLSVTRSQLSFARQALAAAEARYQVGAASWVERATALASFVLAEGDEIRARYAFLQQGLAIGYARGDLETLLVYLNPHEDLP